MSIRRVPSPGAPGRYVRKSDRDARLARHFPIPTQIVSNEEYEPLPQTRRQRDVERLLLDLADRHAPLHGVDRRTFLRSASGMAAAFVALNAVFGRFFTVTAEELASPGATKAPADDYFVLDVQTHHVDASLPPNAADKAFFDYLLGVRRFGGMWNEKLKDREIAPEELHRQNFIKEIFLDSQTDVIVISGLPQWMADTYPISPESIAKTRDLVNELTGSKRAIGHGVMSPELGTKGLESMQAQVERLQLGSWKGYPGQPLGPDGTGWWLDDEKIAYPALELARKLGVKNICLHKGLPAPGFSPEHCNPKDIHRAAKDFPDLNFLVYHAGLKSVHEILPAIQKEFAESSDVPWVSDLCAWKKANPEVKNVYMELGSTFGMTAITLPILCGHILGMILDAFGEDHLLWGTDAIWWGSPQWQIEAFKRFEMPETLTKRFGWKPLTRDVKAKVLGLNAARVYGVDPKAARGPFPDDAIDRLRTLSRDLGGSIPSNTQYGWVRV